MNRRGFALLLLPILLAGCLVNGMDAVGVAKQSAQVQAFLALHPNASISVTLLSSEQAQSQLARFPACADVPSQRLYFVTFQEKDQHAVAFVDESGRELLCAFITPNGTGIGSPSPSPTVGTGTLCPDGLTICPLGYRCVQLGIACRLGQPCKDFGCMTTGSPSPTSSPNPISSPLPSATASPVSISCPDGKLCHYPQICEPRPQFSEKSPIYLCSQLPNSCFDIPPKSGVAYPLETCLPTTTCRSVSANTMVNYKTVSSGMTVLQTLVNMGASCNQGNLYDASGKPIVFYRSACFGNVPAFYAQIEANEQAEIKQLQTQDDVIVLGCNPAIA